MASKRQTGQLTEEEKQRRAELELKIRKRVALEEKAHRIVERLLDNPIEPDFLIDCAKFITPDHYQDVTEERAVSQLCGYPICQKYIKDNFCSNKCFKASNFYKKQIPISPVWARELEPVPKLTLLNDELNKGSIGDIVFNNPKTQHKEELEELEKIDRLTSTHKPVSTTNETTRESTVMEDLTETFKDHMNQLHQADDSAKEITTEKELTERLSKVYMLDEEGSECVESASDNDDKSMEKSQCSKTGKSEKHINNQTTKEPNNKSGSSEYSDSKGVKKKDTNTDHARENKVEHLMQLLDERDALEAELKRQKEKHENSKDSASSVSEPIKEISVTVGVSSDVAGDRKISSESVLKNIQRVEEQQKSDIDSDDEICERNERDKNYVPMVMPSCLKSVKETDYSKTSNSDAFAKSNVQVDVHEHSEPKTSITPYDLIRQILQEWKTDATVEYLRNKKKQSQGISFEEKYEALGRLVDARQIDDDLEDTSDDGQEKPKEKVPEIHKLEKETVEFDLKVKEYFKGKMTRPADVDRKTKEVLEIQEKETSGGSSEVPLPLVDSYAQVALRRRIVLEKFHRVLPDLLGPMSMVVRDVASDMREFVYTFNLSSTNIIMKPAEWTLMAYFLLKLMSLRVKTLSNAMKNESAADFFQILISGIGISESDVQSVMSYMMS